MELNPSSVTMGDPITAGHDHPDSAAGRRSGAGALANHALRAYVNDSGRATGAPPARADAAPTAAAAATSLAAICAALDLPADAIPTPAALENMSPVEIIMLLAQLVGDFSNLSGDLKVKAMEDTAKARHEAALSQNKELRDSIEKSIADAAAGKKGGLFGMLTDWIVATVEAASALGKAIAGDEAGAAADLMAAAGGYVKALAETLAMVDPDNADKYKKMAEIGATIQMIGEMLGVGMNVGSYLRGLAAGKMVAGGAKEALAGANGAGSEAFAGLKTAIGKTDKAATYMEGMGEIETKAGQIGDAVAKDLAPSIKATLEKSDTVLTKLKSTLSRNRLLDAFSEKAIKNMVAEEVTKAAKIVTCGSEAERAGLTAEKFAKTVEEAVRERANSAAFKASFRAAGTVAIQAANGGAAGANTAVGAYIRKEQAEFEKFIDVAQAMMAFLQSVMEAFDGDQRRARDDLSDTVNDGIDMQRKLRDTMHGLAGVAGGAGLTGANSVPNSLPAVAGALV